MVGGGWCKVRTYRAIKRFVYSEVPVHSGVPPNFGAVNGNQTRLDLLDRQAVSSETYHSNWCPNEESNPERLITKQLLYHLTTRANN